MELNDLREMLIHGVNQPIPPKPPPDLFPFKDIPCEDGRPGCRNTPSGLVPSMTAYDWDGEGEDPNRDKLMCPQCAEEYTEMMKEQWDEYYNGRL